MVMMRGVIMRQQLIIDHDLSSNLLKVPLYFLIGVNYNLCLPFPQGIVFILGVEKNNLTIMTIHGTKSPNNFSIAYQIVHSPTSRYICMGYG